MVHGRGSPLRIPWGWAAVFRRYLYLLTEEKVLVILNAELSLKSVFCSIGLLMIVPPFIFPIVTTRFKEDL